MRRTTEQRLSSITAAQQLDELLGQIGPVLQKHGRAADNSVRFATENYALLRQHRVFSAMVPAELGGGAVTYPAMCRFLARLAAWHPSTALSLSMHQHIVAASIYNHRHGRPGKALLEKLAAQELALVSTGAGDWLASSGELKKTEGGYLFSATKHFASGSPAGDILVTSGPYQDPEQGWQVFHFPVSMKATGVSVLDNWQPMGMRATGSNSVQLENVFIADKAISVRRPRGDYHMIWSVILPVALPLIMSVYRGIAETAAERARSRCRQSRDPVTPYLLGEMENALTIAQIAVDDMIRRVDDFGFSADLDTVNEVLKRKTIAATACKQTAEKAVEACGGPGYLRFAGIESLLRDVMASSFHPMQEKRQLLFTGTLAMGDEPQSQSF